MTKQREEKALLEFKHVIDDVIRMLRKSMEADTVYMFWVNRQRQQFVLETSATILPNVMFSDRIEFGEIWLNDYKEINTVQQLKVNEDVAAESLKHYHDYVPARFLTLVPFVNNDETVAVTVIETKHPVNLSDFEDVLLAYQNALLNVLNTYLELTDLYEGQDEWVRYEESLNRISAKMHKTDIIETLLNEMQKLLPTGGAVLVARGMESWVSVMRSPSAPESPCLGLATEEKSMAYDALHRGTPQFSIHFNQNPRRINSEETRTEGATLAIPLLINDRRHAVILAFDKNPLVFKESTKHKLQNFVRLATLSIQVNLGKLPPDMDLFTSEYGNFIPELWEKTLASQIKRAGANSEKCWFGFVAIGNATELRSRLRLDALKRLQRIVVNQLNPARMGFNGFIGFHSDYTYPFLLTGFSDDTLDAWKLAMEKKFSNPVELVEGQKVSLEMKMGAVYIDSPGVEPHEITESAKRELSRSMKNGIKPAGNF
jgi:hypothetical protein